MAKRCIFCGKEFGLFGGGLVTCGDTEQPACSDCSRLLSDLSPTERAEKALETGRAVEAESLQKYLIREKLRQERESAQIEQARQAIRTDKTCLRCGGPMEKYATKLLHLCDEGLLGPMDGLFALWPKVEILRCANCGKAEFFLPEPPELPDVEEEMVTCPEWGTPKEKTSPKQETGRQNTKPPWEK